ncbi:MAG: hypothetical protein R3182_09935 [Draconibacterium sp.]|nr:hypothetical protein [Draconibacterium sp.]
MTNQNYFRLFVGVLLCSFFIQSKAQTSVSLRSQWLDPTNLFTEDTPTMEFATNVTIVGPFNLHFYYAHDMHNLIPIYLIGGINYSHTSKIVENLLLPNNKLQEIPKVSKDIMFTYQYFHTLDQLSALQPVFTINRNFVSNPSASVHTLMAEFSPWMSLQREYWYQDGFYLTTKYNYAKFINKWEFNTNISAIAVKVVEEDWDAFVIGAVFGISTKFLPFNSSLDIVLNKPLITDEENDLDFTIGITKEF